MNTLKMFISTMTALLLVFGNAWACEPEDPCGDPSSDTMTIVDISAGTMFNGSIGAGFTNGDGFNDVSKTGGAYTDLSAVLGGDLCGPDCQDAQVSAALTAEEHLGVIGGVQSSSADQTTTLENLGTEQIGLQLNVGSDSVMLGGKTGMLGQTAGAFSGGDGTVVSNQEGGSGLISEMNYNGPGCGINCGDGSFNLEGYAYEAVQTTVNASGSTPGTPVTATNAGKTEAAIQFMFQKN